MRGDRSIERTWSVGARSPSRPVLEKLRLRLGVLPAERFVPAGVSSILLQDFAWMMSDILLGGRWAPPPASAVARPIGRLLPAPNCASDVRTAHPFTSTRTQSRAAPPDARPLWTCRIALRIRFHDPASATSPDIQCPLTARATSASRAFPSRYMPARLHDSAQPTAHPPALRNTRPHRRP
jgi:hypothetical protein